MYGGAEASPKVKHFLWRLCTTSLPVRDLLHYRHFIDDATCPWGCGERETTMHAIFGCPRLQALWEDCGCEGMRTLGLQQPMCEVMVAWQAIDVKVRRKGYALAWVIWGERNNWVFNQKSTPHQVIVNRVFKLAEEYDSYVARIYPPMRSRVWA